MSKKFGSNHAKGMLYQGLTELGNALVSESNVSQRHLEHGVWGLGDPPAGTAMTPPGSAAPGGSVLDRRVAAAKAEASFAREAQLKSDPVIAPPAHELERD